MATWRFVYPKRLSFSPLDYESPGLGGGESRLVLLSRGLAARGHQVEVYNATWSPGVYEGVRWRGAWELDAAGPVDVSVSVRFASAVEVPAAGCYLFWMLDDRTAGAEHFSSQHAEGTVVVASDAMQARLAESLRVAKIPLPVNPDDYRGASLPSSNQVCLYSSMPNRGLKPLLEMWPKVRAAVPGAELLVTSGWELWGYEAEEAADRWSQIIGDHRLPKGVTRLGTVSHSEFVAIQMSARVGLFPSTFPEMFCLSAAEIATAGRPIVASDLEALSERAITGKTGFLIPGDPRAPEVQERFVERTVHCLSDDVAADELGAAAKRLSQAYDIERVLDEWETQAGV